MKKKKREEIYFGYHFEQTFGLTLDYYSTPPLLQLLLGKRTDALCTRGGGHDSPNKQTNSTKEREKRESIFSRRERCRFGGWWWWQRQRITWRFHHNRLFFLLLLLFIDHQ